MKKRLGGFSPLRMGTVLAATTFLFFLVLFLPLQLFLILAHGNVGSVSRDMLLIFAFTPFFYAVLGFLFGALASVIYNFVVRFTGGIEVTVEDIQ